MPLYMVRWPNGDLSFVKARNKDDACILLDEVGDANGCPIKAIRDDDEFMVHLQLADSGFLEMQEFGELMHQAVYSWAYPILDKVLGYGDVPPEAIEEERNRVTQHVTNPHPMLADVAAVAKRISIGKNMGLADPSRSVRHEEPKTPTEL
jgi:hypothetical protein